MKVTRIYRFNQASNKKICLNRGGTRSSKSWSLVQLAFVWLTTGQIKPTDKVQTEGVWSIVRSTMPALKSTVLRDFRTIVQEEGFLGAIHENKTDLIFTYGGRMVEFMATDSEQKIRSRKRDYLHLCEANEIPWEIFVQLMIRTKGRVFLDLNPDDPGSWVKTEIEEVRKERMGDVEVIVSTYKDNPTLSATEIREIEYLKEVNGDLWAVFGNGEWGQKRGAIFPDPIIIPHFPENLDVSYGGIDWGFAKDPTAVVRVGKHNDHLYLDEVLYQAGLVNSEIHPYLNQSLLYVADSAEPKSIEDLRRMGTKIIPSVKGADSIRSGLARMNEFKIHITARSVNLLKEFRNYKRDNDGDPIDAFNHAIDAARYVVQTKLKKHQDVGELYQISTFDSSVGHFGGSGRMV